MPDVHRLNQTLEFLDNLYNQHLTSEDSEESVAFSKLAVIEFCGWVETTIDDIARSSVLISLPTASDRPSLEKLIQDTSGFDYKRHIIPLLAHSIGIVKYTQVEETLKEEGLLEQLTTTLNSEFKKMRNRAAHTFLDGVQRNYDAPSLIKGKVTQILPVLDRLRSLCEELDDD